MTENQSLAMFAVSLAIAAALYGSVLYTVLQ